MIAFVLRKLAPNAQTAIDSLTSFARLIQAVILHRKRLDRLGGRQLHDHAQPA